MLIVAKKTAVPETRGKREGKVHILTVVWDVRTYESNWRALIQQMGLESKCLNEAWERKSRESMT